LADRLARAGFAVASFAFSDARVPLQFRELDLVLDALRRGEVGAATETYGLIGHGTGGAIALLRSVDDKRVRALVTWAVVARLGHGEGALDLLSAARAVRVPWLLVQGTDEEARELLDAAHESAEILASNLAPDQTVRATVAWLARHLP
jgi:alpha-beta hydrolase superfamily lysophospholipase